MPQTPLFQVAGYSYKHISTQTTTVIKAFPGFLHSIVVNSATSGAVVTIYDNASTSGNIIAIWGLGTITTPQPAVVFDINFALGCTIITGTQNCDLTITYR